MTAVTHRRVALICAHRYTDAVGPVRAAQPAGSVGGSSSAVPATQFALPNPGIRHARGSMPRGPACLRSCFQQIADFAKRLSSPPRACRSAIPVLMRFARWPVRCVRFAASG